MKADMTTENKNSSAERKASWPVGLPREHLKRVNTEKRADESTTDLPF